MYRTTLAAMSLMILMVCLPTPGAGFEFDSITDDRQESTLTLGYGNCYNIHDEPQEGFQSAIIRYRYGRFTSPRNETAYEFTNAYHFNGKQNITFAATIGYRHYFMVQGQAALAFDLGIGGMHMTRHLPQQATKTNFTEYAGVTFQYALDDDSAFTLTYRFSHSSNARIARPNGGINISEFNLGYMWLY